jgi:hypothetical protein
MDGKNSSGRRVSLLNDDIEAPQLVRLPSITPSLRSHASSYTSSPIGSPPTPRLIRSDSSDSVTMQTPSPITPDFAFDTLPQDLHSPNYAQPHYFDMQQKDYNNAYPPVPHTTGPLPYHAQAGFFRPQQIPEQHVAPSVAAPAPVRPKKNSYPCPMAKQFQCSDYFTTSGHAARHAKKHTGKKDAYCPECNKAFTRKDNMEQHRRTHQSGRSAKGSESGVKKSRPAAKRPRPSPLQSSLPTMSHPNLDPSLPISPDGTIFMAPAVQPAEQYMDLPSMQRSTYPDPTNYSMTHSQSYSIGSSSGLDALAIAASGERKSEL